jgi:hypothetical protein
MTRTRDELRATLEHWDTRLEKTEPGEPAALLDALVTASDHSSDDDKPLRPAQQTWRRRKRKGE